VKLLIAYDGSDPAQAAIRGLTRAGLPHTVQATILSVADVPTEARVANYASGEAAAAALPPMVALAVRDETARVIKDAQETAASGAELVRAQFPDWTVDSESRVDSPSGAIVRCIEQISADLVVVGRSGRSGLDRLLLGSVSQNVLTHAPCSVHIGPQHGPVSEPNAARPIKLLLGIDGSHYSAAAVSAVAARAWPAGTQVTIVAALDQRFWLALAGSPARAWAGAGDEDQRSWARKAVESVARELRDAGLETTTLVDQADPRKLLLDQANQSNADCIFLGARGHGRVVKFLLGSVSASIAARAQCAVEVVRQG
jgi:nucleotide-binding universal stress UspA family protein